MMKTLIELEQNQDWLKIEGLDLELVLMKIMSSPYLHWSINEGEQAILEYRKFLFLQKKYPTTLMAPTKAVDEVWHTHILFTKKYFADCQIVFGKYLHHNPHTGMSPQVSIDQFDTTKRLYRITFGTELLNSDRAESGGSCSGGSCTGNCSVGCGG